MTFTAKTRIVARVKSRFGTLYTWFRYHNLVAKIYFTTWLSYAYPGAYFLWETGSPVSRSRRAQKQSSVLPVMQPRLTSDCNLFFENAVRVAPRDKKEEIMALQRILLLLDFI